MVPRNTKFPALPAFWPMASGQGLCIRVVIVDTSSPTSDPWEGSPTLPVLLLCGSERVAVSGASVERSDRTLYQLYLYYIYIYIYIYFAHPIYYLRTSSLSLSLSPSNS